MSKKEIKDQLIEIHTQEAKRHVQKIKQSFRWKAGHAFARLIEMFLWRKKQKLSIDFLEEHLQTIEELSLQSNQPKTSTPLSLALQEAQQISFLVSDTNIEESVFGDTHVAHDFKLALEEHFPGLRGRLVHYKQISELDACDLLINMLWDTTLPENKEALKPFTIAWVRNYPDRWLANPSFLKYDLFLCSSDKIKNYIQQHTQKPVYLFPIAANINRFQAGDEKNASDKIVFVGNKWKENRHIENLLKSKDAIKQSLEIYGKGWDKIADGGLIKGPVSNQQIPKLYQQARIVLDAANETTQKWASLNSRVFNAIATKKIVLTDSVEAAQLFKYPVPVYENTAMLYEQIKKFNTDAGAYNTASHQLYEELKHLHTYAHRVNRLQLIMARKLNIALKIAPKKEQKQQFGDWYFAQALAKAFKQYGHQVSIDVFEDWHTPQTQNADLVISLRGIRAYQPLKQQCNFLWLISHPEAVSLQEIQQYQHCFLASDYHFKKLHSQNIPNVSLLHQCTDTAVFTHKASYKKNKKLLFVGNSRNIFRKSVDYALKCGYDIDVYGMGWKQFIPVKYIKAEFVANDQLFELYHQYEIVLNDHWEDMLCYGYVSNRLFDASACAAQIVSDCPKGAEHILPDIYYYHDQASFKNQIEAIRTQNGSRNFRHYYTVCNQHTFKHRAETILQQYYTTADEKMA